MATVNFSIRLNTDIVEKLDKIAFEKEWSRNFVISKFLKEKVYELARD
jgi:predicted transcriptional regulator